MISFIYKPVDIFYYKFNFTNKFRIIIKNIYSNSWVKNNIVIKLVIRGYIIGF